MGEMPPADTRLDMLDEVYISQIGDDQDGFFDFFTKVVTPRLGP